MCGKVGEVVFRHPEILRQYRLWCMREPVGDQKGRIFRKPPSSNTRRNSHPSANPWIGLENSVDSSWLSASSSENYYRRNHDEGEGQDNDA